MKSLFMLAIMPLNLWQFYGNFIITFIMPFMSTNKLTQNPLSSGEKFDEVAKKL